MMADSLELGIAFGSAGDTTVFMCVATTCKSGYCVKNAFSCSSRAVAGDLPDGNLCKITSKTFAFILYNQTAECPVAGLLNLRHANVACMTQDPKNR